MHIFHLVPNMNFGGLQKVVRLLSLGQRQRGLTVTIGCWTNESNHPEAHAELEAEGVRIIYLRRDRDGSLVFGRSRLFGILKSRLGGVDVLHVHNPFAYFLYGALAGRTSRIKVVLTLHATA